MTIYYLYVKTHRITGLKYLGQTQKNPLKYKGSGLDWIAHIKQHGYNVDTEILLTTASKEERNYWGRYYSNQWQVVTGQDDFGNKIWANRIPETGGSSLEGTKQSPEHIAKRVAKNKGKKRTEEFKQSRTGDNNSFYKKKHTERTKKLMKENHADVSGTNNPMFGKPHPNAGKKGLWKWSKNVPKFYCTHCSREIGGVANFSRFHGDNCKKKSLL